LTLANRNYKFADVHEEGARRIARIAYQAGVSRFVHMSHLNAVEDSKSRYYQSKARSETAVREAFPGATVVRPSTLYGHEDRFLNSIASYTAGWRINGQETIIKPVHVLDVAEALKTISNAESTIGATFSLPGPRPYTIEQLIALVEANVVKKLQGPNVPVPVLSLLTRIWENVWWPTLSPDEVVRRCIDDLDVPAGHLSWDYLGMTPDQLEDQALVYLRRHRSAAYYDSAFRFRSCWS
jgi:NADH dehydrogenase (ubiquinone) 1 alpha subcomplex subunit 9